MAKPKTPPKTIAKSKTIDVVKVISQTPGGTVNETEEPLTNEKLDPKL